MIRFRVQTNNIKPSTKKKQLQFMQLPQQAHKVWVQNTPIDTGNARRKTTLRGKVIDANYPYAVPLDQGRSRQSPRGMVRPTEQFIKSRIKQILGAK